MHANTARALVTGASSGLGAADVADYDATFARLEQLDRESGGMDMVIANAGIAGLPAALSGPLITRPGSGPGG